MNKAILMGRMVRDPELKTGGANNKAYTRFTLAVQRNYKNASGNYDADFISCAAFGKSAENICKYFGKGNRIIVIGQIRTGSYDKDGHKVYTTDVYVENFDFVDSKNGNSGNSGNSGSGGGTANKADDDFMNVPDGIDPELPFG